MPAFNFKQTFASDVESGVKRQTIRAKRKHRPKAGQTAYCFHGMRTPKCRCLGAWPICRVRDVRINDCGILLDGGAVLDNDLNTFARADGFKTWPIMLEWFRATHCFPFHGDLIQWDYRPT